MSCSLSLIRDDAGDLSFPCPPRTGLRELDQIHRTLPPPPLLNEDEDVLQDETGLSILDEQTNGFIYDNWK